MCVRDTLPPKSIPVWVLRSHMSVTFDPALQGGGVLVGGQGFPGTCMLGEQPSLWISCGLSLLLVSLSISPADGAQD